MLTKMRINYKVFGLSFDELQIDKQALGSLKLRVRPWKYEYAGEGDASHLLGQVRYHILTKPPN